MEYVRLKEEGILIETSSEEELNFLGSKLLEKIIPSERIKKEIPRGRLGRVLKEDSFGFDIKIQETCAWVEREAVTELTDLENKILSMEGYLSGSK